MPKKCLSNCCAVFEINGWPLAIATRKMYRIHVSKATVKIYIAQMKLEKCIRKPSKRVNVVNVKVNIGRIPYLTMNIGSVSLSAYVGTYR